RTLGAGGADGGLRTADGGLGRAGFFRGEDIRSDDTAARTGALHARRVDFLFLGEFFCERGNFHATFGRNGGRSMEDWFRFLSSVLCLRCLRLSRGLALDLVLRRRGGTGIFLFFLRRFFL